MEWNEGGGGGNIAQERTAANKRREGDRVDRYTQKRRNIGHIYVRRAVDNNGIQHDLKAVIVGRKGEDI